MPIFEIKTNQPITDAEVISDRVRLPTLEALNSPNPKDWEYRVTRALAKSSEVAYSCGRIEYPLERPDKIFDPSETQMLAAAHVVQNELTPDFGHIPVTIKAWGNTSFLERNPGNHPKPDSVITYRQKLPLSPKMIVSLSPEASLTTEETIPSTILALKEIITATVGQEIQVEVTTTLDTLTGASFEVRFPGITAQNFPAEVSDYIASACMSVIDHNIDPNIPANIWVMPGAPKTVTIN